MKVEVAVLGSLSLIVLMVSVDVKQQSKLVWPLTRHASILLTDLGPPYQRWYQETDPRTARVWRCSGYEGKGLLSGTVHQGLSRVRSIRGCSLAVTLQPK